MEQITLPGIITGAALPLFGYLAVHYLAISREKISRFAKASNDFRESIIKAASKIPSSDSLWDNNTLSDIQKVKSDVKVAIEIFKYFLSEYEMRNIDNDFKRFDDLITNKIPHALSAAEIMYGGGQQTANETKQSFHSSIEKFKNYAKKT